MSKFMGFTGALSLTIKQKHLEFESIFVSTTELRDSDSDSDQMFLKSSGTSQ